MKTLSEKVTSKSRKKKKKKVRVPSKTAKKVNSKQSDLVASTMSSVPSASTEKKFNKKSFAISVLRRASYKLRSRNQAFTNARVERGKYKCALCGGIFGRKEIQVDHIVPVVGPEGFVSWDMYIDRMFPDDASGWQMLCKDGCHAKKTQKENEERKLVRMKLKEKK